MTNFANKCTYRESFSSVHWQRSRRTEAKRTNTEVHKPQGFSRGGESHWLAANRRICGCYLYAYTHDERTTTVGQADDPEAKQTRSLKAPRDNDNASEKGLSRRKMKRHGEKLLP